MPFPLKVKMQMPCQHWNQFPVAATFSTMSSISGSAPPTPEQMPYCKLCRAQEKQK